MLSVYKKTDGHYIRRREPNPYYRSAVVLYKKGELFNIARWNNVGLVRLWINTFYFYDKSGNEVGRIKLSKGYELVVYSNVAFIDRNRNKQIQ